MPFSPTGQLWGNPLYDWDYHKKTGYAWWISRLQYAASLYDVVRIDHFRGFESYYTIPYGNKDATVGKWRKGPNKALFQAAKKELGDLRIIAEDLGFITPGVRKMLDAVGYPGMKVLQFGFDSDPSNEHLPHNFQTPHCVCYTGTHDNETLKGWLAASNKKTVKYAKNYLRCKKQQIPDEMVAACWAEHRGGGSRTGTGFPAFREKRQDEYALDPRRQLDVPDKHGGFHAGARQGDPQAQPHLRQIGRAARTGGHQARTQAGAGKAGKAPPPLHPQEDRAPRTAVA